MGCVCGWVWVWAVCVGGCNVGVWVVSEWVGAVCTCVCGCVCVYGGVLLVVCLNTSIY